MRDTMRKGSSRVVAATAGAGLALALLTGGAGAAAADRGAPDDFLAPGQSRLGLPPGVELDGAADTVAGGAWTPADGLLYVITLGSSTCPRIAEPMAANTVAGTGLAVDDEVGDIDVTLKEPEPGAVCTADWVPTTTVVAVPDGKDNGETVSLRIGGVGKTDLSPRTVPGETGPPAWISIDR